MITISSAPLTHPLERTTQPQVDGVPSGDGEMDNGKRARLNRLRWHCRRALLELDLVFQRFWEHHGDAVDEETEETLRRLLAMEDHDIWYLVSGQEETADPQLGKLIVALRQVEAAGSAGKQI